MIVMSKELDSKPIIIQMTTKKGNNDVSGRTIKRVSEDTASYLMKSEKKEALTVLGTDFVRRKKI